MPVTDGNDRQPGDDAVTLSLATFGPVVAAPFVGSFLSLLAVRLPRDEDVVVSRSHCRSCGHVLAPMELVPVVSWVAMSGRCLHCDKPISALYPIVETAALGIAVWATLVVNGPLLWLTVVLGWALIALAAMDVLEFTLSDAITLPLIALGLVVIAFLDFSQLWLHVAGALAGYALIAALASAYRTMRGHDGIGLGDAKLLAAAGAWVGLQGLGTVLLYGVVVSLALALVIRLRGHEVGRMTQIPFGVGIATGLWLTWLYGPLVPV